MIKRRTKIDQSNRTMVLMTVVIDDHHGHGQPNTKNEIFLYYFTSSLHTSTKKFRISASWHSSTRAVQGSIRSTFYAFREQ